MALLVVSHQLDLVHAYTDEAHLLRHGRTTAVQPSAMGGGEQFDQVVEGFSGPDE